MRRFRRAGLILATAFSVAGLLLGTVSAQAQPLDAVFPDGVRFGFVLRVDSLPKAAAEMNWILRLDQEGRPTLLAGDTLFILDKRNALSWTLKGGAGVSDYTWLADGTLIGVRQNSLIFPGPNGEATLLAMPEAGMRLAAAGEDRLYLYGGTSREQRLKAYVLKKGAGLLSLVETPYPITAMSGNGENTFFAIGRSVMFMSEGQPVSLVYRPRFEVDHLAYAPPHGLFYATGQDVGFVLETGHGYPFLTARGATPLVHGEDLYIMIPKVGVLRASPTSAFAAMAKELAGGSDK